MIEAINMAFYECADKKHTVTVNIQMGWTSGGHHQCTASVYNDGPSTVTWQFGANIKF